MVYMIPCINYTRVESAHWSLKKVLGSSMGDLCSCWDGIHNVIILQHNEIKTSFERSINLMSDSYKALSYRRLVGNISLTPVGYPRNIHFIALGSNLPSFT